MWFNHYPESGEIGAIQMITRGTIAISGKGEPLLQPQSPRMTWIFLPLFRIKRALNDLPVIKEVQSGGGGYSNPTEQLSDMETPKAGEKSGVRSQYLCKGRKNGRTPD